MARSFAYTIDNPGALLFPDPILSNRDPTSTDRAFSAGQLWINKATNTVHIKTTIKGPVNWSNLSSTGGVNTFNTDSGTAIGAGSAISMLGGKGINITGAGSTVTVEMQSAFTGDFQFTETAAGNTETLSATHSDNTNVASDAEVLVESGGTSGGDAQIRMAISGGKQYVAGVANGVTNDPFRIVDGADLEAAIPFFEFDPVDNEITESVGRQVFDGISGSFAGSEFKREQGSIQSIGAGTSDVHTYTLPANSAVNINYNYVFAKSDHSSAGGGRVTVQARRAGAGAILIGIDQMFNEDDPGAPGITAVVSGNDVILRATTVAGIYNHVATADIQPILTNI